MVIDNNSRRHIFFDSESYNCCKVRSSIFHLAGRGTLEKSLGVCKVKIKIYSPDYQSLKFVTLMDCLYISEVTWFIPPSMGSSSSLGEGTAFSSEAKDSTTNGASRNFNNCVAWQEKNQTSSFISGLQWEMMRGLLANIAGSETLSLVQCLSTSRSTNSDPLSLKKLWEAI